MSLITSKAGLAKARQLCRVAEVKHSLIKGDKRVTQALEIMDPPVTLVIVSDDGGSAYLVAKATEHGLPIIRLPTRSDVGEIVGYTSVSSCVLSFVGDEKLLTQLLHLG